MGIADRGWPPSTKGKLIGSTVAQTGTWYAITVLSQGNPSSIYIVTTTAAQTGTWNSILALAATVFSTLTELGATLVGTLASAPFPVGARIYGTFTNFTLTSGSVRAEGPAIPFATVTDSALSRQDGFGSVEFAVGTTIYGTFTNFTLNKGAVVIAWDDKATSE